MGSFTDFIRGGGKEPRNELDPRGEQIRMGCLEETFKGYERVGTFPGASSHAPTMRERDAVESVLAAVATALRIPKERVLEETDVGILLSVRTSDGEIVARRKEPCGRCA